jgi:hypothetical protein
MIEKIRPYAWYHLSRWATPHMEIGWFEDNGIDCNMFIDFGVLCFSFGLTIELAVRYDERKQKYVLKKRRSK